MRDGGYLEQVSHTSLIRMGFGRIATVATSRWRHTSLMWLPVHGVHK